MRKINIIIIGIVIALIFGIIGFFIGNNVNLKNDNKKIVGTYKTSNWNGKEAVLVLNADKTMIHPNGYTGTWLFQDNKLFIEYKMEIPTLDDTGNQSDQKKKTKQEISIVPNGVIINTHFFEKIK